LHVPGVRMRPIRPLIGLGEPYINKHSASST
jgi:hypothetical protein